MAKSLGPKLPEDLTRRLYEPQESGSFERVILVATQDQDGWPRYFMLSHYEVVAKDQSHILMLTYSDSKSTQNIVRTGKATLLFLDEEMSYYVKVLCKQTQEKIDEAPYETLFRADVVDVIQDKLPTAKITSGIRFSGYDPVRSEDARRRVFQRLVEL